MRPQNLQRWWDKNRDMLGAGGFSLHQLRHSNLSMMARFMSPFDLHHWAGWSSLAPASVYIHDDLDSMRSAVRKSEVRISDAQQHRNSTTTKKGQSLNGPDLPIFMVG